MKKLIARFIIILLIVMMVCILAYNIINAGWYFVFSMMYLAAIGAIGIWAIDKA